MSGFVAIHRGIFDHPIFKDEPFTEREAWVWLISEAAWKKTRVRVGGVWVNLERGELAHSLRHMQSEWKWSSEKRVRTFLKKLENDRMIDASKTTQGVTHLTICNYDEYQPGGRSDGRTTDAPRTQHGRKEEEVNNITIDHGGGEGAAEADEAEKRSPLISPWAYDLADEIAALCGHDPKNPPAAWFGAPMRVETWRAHGWDREVCLASIRGQIANKRDGPPSSVKYFERGIARAHAERSTPLPDAKLTPTGGKIAATQNLSAVARRFAEGGISFGPKPSLAGNRGAENGPPVRMLPEG